MPESACAVLYGNFSPGLGGWCYAQAFDAAGWRVITVSDTVGLERYASDFWLRVRRKLWNQVRPRDRVAHLAVLHEAIRTHRPCMVVVLRGLCVGPEEVRVIRTTGAWVVNINHDDYFSQTRSNRSSLLTAALPEYDHLLTPRAVNCRELAPINPRVAYFPFSYHPPIHRPVPIPAPEESQWGVDVSFVGTFAPQRVGLLEELVRRHRCTYAIYGTGWHKLSHRSPLRPFVRMHSVLFDDLAKALGGARVSLGFLRNENRDDYTQRTFEIPACGGVLLAERTPMHQSLFREGVEAEYFDPAGPEELVEKVRELLADAGRRNAVRAAGLAAVTRTGYTYTNRVRQLLDLYEAHR